MMKNAHSSSFVRKSVSTCQLFVRKSVPLDLLFVRKSVSHEENFI